jgi:peptidoglycan/xylan/chitin deacetylase (PgdA/CDA1 family)
MTIHTKPRSRRVARSITVLAAAVATATGVLLPSAANTAGAAPAPTIISLNFDDGFANQMDALPIMQARGYTGTFYIISGLLGNANRLTAANLLTLQAAGNEIAGHTTQHSDLTTLSAIEQQRTICNDRLALTNLGLTVTDFAYPYGSYNATAEQSVAACGYNSARATGGLGYSPTWAESVPPVDPYAINAVDGVVSTTTLASVQNSISNAIRHGGGWLPLLFHNICTGCSDLSVTKANFTALLDWIKTQERNGVVVRTMAQVINQPAQPVVAGPPDARPEGTLVNASVEDSALVADPISNSLLPACYEAGGYGTNSVTWARTNNAHSGSWGETITMNSLTSGDAKLMMRRDEGTCSPGVVAGHQYTLGAWYQSTVPTRIVAYYGDMTGRWVYWAQSPIQAASSTWKQITWVTPAMPSAGAHLSFGLYIAGAGHLTTDDYTMTVK